MSTTTAPLAGAAAARSTPASLRRRGSSLDTLPQLPPRDGSASSATPPVRALYKDDELLVPPGKYGLVEPGVHRSAFPSPASFRFLRLLGHPRRFRASLLAGPRQRDAVLGRRRPLSSLPDGRLRRLRRLSRLRRLPRRLH